MSDPRTPRKLKTRSLNALVFDANTFSRNLISEILRGLGVSNVLCARDLGEAANFLKDQQVDVIFISWEEAEAFDGLGYVRRLRQNRDDRLRRLPAILVTGSLTRQTVIAGRDAGVDEFLAKPISPTAMLQRLQMVIETPRPFVDCTAYLGPCRRRKNPADYHGAKRREDDHASEQPNTLVDQDEVARQTPIRVALARLRQSCAQLRAGQAESLAAAMAEMRIAKDLAVQQKDHALHAGLASFEAYLGVATPNGQLEETVTSAAMMALEQLAALPANYAEARDSVALALGKAIQKKLAA